MADSHYSQRLGKWLQLERSEASLKGGGWLDVVPKKLAGDKVGYHVKMRKDPNNSGAQDTLPGKALDTPREAAIRRAEWIAEHPFPPKAAGRKVRPPFAPSFSESHHVMCDSCLSQVKLKRKAEGKEEERLSSRPAWVVDHNLCTLWSEGLDEEMIPEELRLTADAKAQVKRLQMWAEEQVAQVEQEQQGQQEQPLPPPPAPLPTVPTVAAAAFVSPLPVARVPVAPMRFDPAVLAQVAALKSGPRVGPSPATVLEM